MTANDWNAKFGEQFIISLTNEERKYFGLNEIIPNWDIQCLYSKTNLWYTRVAIFFDGNVIVKCITETKRVLDNGTINFRDYTEYDTSLNTIDKRILLPLTSRGKQKPLTASNVRAVTPFGCSFYICFEDNSTRILLYNPRANKDFPIGEENRISSIKSDDDFHNFTKYYISTCRDDYFEKLEQFKSAKKVTIKYKPGDIFRMEYDRTHYCYGIITGEIKKFKNMPELPQRHSFRSLMMVPIMVRLYEVYTENPNLKSYELQQYPLGHVKICGDNDIIWGTHAIVDHKKLEPTDLEFNFICTKIISYNKHKTVFTDDFFTKEGFISGEEYELYIEWGFANTSLQYSQLSEKLKFLLKDYSSPHGGISMGIDPGDAVLDEKRCNYPSHKNNLLNPANREILNEIFACLDMKPDSSFDEFAVKFGGLSLQEIIQRIN